MLTRDTTLINCGIHLWEVFVQISPADMDARDCNGENALFYATRGRDLHVIEALLAAGVAVVTNHYGVNILSQVRGHSLSDRPKSHTHNTQTHTHTHAHRAVWL